MKINRAKTKIILFNKSQIFDFPPEITLQNSETFLDVVDQSRLLGLQVTTDLRWAAHTQSIIKRANSKLWMLRRMKFLNIDPYIIIDFYFKEIRSICEMACQVFHSGLTKNQSNDIENIQKKALKIILGRSYHSYEVACTLMSAEPLYDRRLSQCLKFVRKAVKSRLHTDIFIHTKNSITTRSSINKKLLEYTCNSQRYFNSPLVFLSRLYNQNMK